MFFLFSSRPFFATPKAIGFSGCCVLNHVISSVAEKGDHMQTFLLGGSIFEDFNLNLTQKESDKNDMFNMGSLFQLKMSINLNPYFVVTLQRTTMEHPSKLYSRCIAMYIILEKVHFQPTLFLLESGISTLQYVDAQLCDWVYCCSKTHPANHLKRQKLQLIVSEAVFVPMFFGLLPSRVLFFVGLIYTPVN